MSNVLLVESSRCDVIGVSFPHVTEGLVDRIHRNNGLVFVWGCRDSVEIKKALELDVDGIGSDFPDLVIQELSQGM